MTEKVNLYRKIKSELIACGCSTRYFTREFLSTYAAALKHFREIEIDDSYLDGHVILFHSFDPVYTSDFYRKNSCSYCEFLVLYNAYAERS